MKRIYLDYASITPVDPRVVREMRRYSSLSYANPSSIYREGVAATQAMEEGRKEVAGFIHAHADEVVFTSGGTEANGLALEGAGRAARRAGNEKPHLITTNIEHSSIVSMVEMLEKHGVDVTRLAVGPDGRVSPDELKKAIRPTTFMVSVMTVNNEIGTVQPIREIAKVVRHARTHVTKSAYPLLHTDAAQAAQLFDLNVEQLGVDLMTLDGAKAYGPRGIGALYVRRGTPIEPIIYGGGQEHGLRSGTENVAAIMGFAKALELCRPRPLAILVTKNGPKQQVPQDDNKNPLTFKEATRLLELKDLLFEGLRKIRPDITLNPAGLDISDPALAPHILNVSIPGIDNEYFVLQLDAKGIAASTKSSCLRDEDESYVLRAVGADSRTSVRFSLGRWTKPRDTAKTLKVVAKILES